MSLQRFLILMTFATIVSWASWAIVLFTIDPDANRTLALFLFFGSLTLALTGTLTLLGFLCRALFVKDLALFQEIGVSFRQGAFLALFIVGLLLLKGERFLTWWAALSLFLFFSLLEFFFHAEEQANP